MVAFDGRTQMHANVVYPCDAGEVEHLPPQLRNMIVSLYYQSQQESYIENSYARQQLSESDVASAQRFMRLTDDQLHDDEVLREVPPYQLQRLRNICRNYIKLVDAGVDGTDLNAMGICPIEVTAIRNIK